MDDDLFSHRGFQEYADNLKTDSMLAFGEALRKESRGRSSRPEMNCGRQRSPRVGLQKTPVENKNKSDDIAWHMYKSPQRRNNKKDSNEKIALCTDRIGNKMEKETFETKRARYKKDNQIEYVCKNPTMFKSADALLSAKAIHENDDPSKEFEQAMDKGYNYCQSQVVRINESKEEYIRPRCQSESRKQPQKAYYHLSRRKSCQSGENGTSEKSAPKVESNQSLKSAASMPVMRLKINLPSENFEDLAEEFSPTVGNEENYENRNPVKSHFTFDETTALLNNDRNAVAESKADALKIQDMTSLGSLRVKIQYLIVTKRIKLTVIQAYGLPAKYSNRTYARACLMPGKQEKQSSIVVKKTRNPVYNSVMYFHNILLPDAHNKIVRVKIMSKRSLFLCAQPVGIIRVNLDKLDLVSETDVEQDLEPYFPEDDREEAEIIWEKSVLDTDDFNWD